jgi:hypothetical protein
MDLRRAKGLKVLHQPEGWRFVAAQSDCKTMRNRGLDDLGRGVDRVETLFDPDHELIELPLAEPLAHPGIPNAGIVLQEERGERQLAAAFGQDKK